MAFSQQPKRKANHPYHLHVLAKTDSREIYLAYQAKWRCDACGRTFEGTRDRTISEDSEEPDHRHTYHCNFCATFDICTQCFTGYVRKFHPHRLKKAKAAIIYQQTQGQWKCDACKRIFSEFSDQDCYHCQKCDVDLCGKCFDGNWAHVLHDKQSHTLRPVDPRLQYRYYTDWQCDGCRTSFAVGEEPHLLFHCDKCDFDLCPECFTGKKHHLHKHHLATVRGSGYYTRSAVFCSNCSIRITEPQYYSCCDPTCRFVLCGTCFSTTAPTHPYHPHPYHTLELCNSTEVYPQSGGMWHCDNCTVKSPTREPRPLTSSDDMYHCTRCEYDLCSSCYHGGLNKQQRNSLTSPEESTSQPVPVQESPTAPFYQPYTLRYYTRPVITGTHPPLSFLTSPLVPPHRLCMVCQLHEATMTFIHQGLPHSGPPLCCQKCTAEIMHYQKMCPACGMIPERAVDVSL